VFGHLPLAMVLLVLYLSTWLAFRASRRAFSPVIALTRQVRGLDPAAPDPALLDPARLPRDATCVNDVLTDELECARLLAAFRQFRFDGPGNQWPVLVQTVRARGGSYLRRPGRRVAHRSGHRLRAGRAGTLL
jgi:hypothetical protein